jgi:hypothetical protein
VLAAVARCHAWLGLEAAQGSTFTINLQLRRRRWPPILRSPAIAAPDGGVPPPARERASASTHLFSNAVPAIHTSSSHPHPLHLPLLLLPSHQIAPVLLVACSLLAACHLYSRIEKSRTKVLNPAQPATSVAGPSFAGRSGHDGGTLAATPRGSRAALRPPPMALPPTEPPPTEPPPTEPRTPSPPPPPLSPSTPSGW